MCDWADCQQSRVKYARQLGYFANCDYVDPRLWAESGAQTIAEYEGYLRDRLEAHTEARTLWRESIGRLLIDARAVGDTEAADRIAAMDARWGPGAAEGGLSLAAAAR